MTSAAVTDSEPNREALHAAVETHVAARRPFRATYRLQFQAPVFGFAAARDIAGYLQKLGVSHVYASPYLKARRGSTHGYEVVDYSRLHDELGSESDYHAMADALQAHGLGQILDVVPNHMSVETDENVWWLDVLMHGPASRYAAYFDIDWQPVKRELENRLLLPILGDLYGNVLEAGEIALEFHLGGFFARCQSLQLPLDPRTWPRVLSPGVAELAAASPEDPHLLELQSILLALEHLPPRTETTPGRIADRHRETVVIRNRLRSLAHESPVVAEHIARNILRLNGTPGQADSFDELDRLLNEQAYQLVHWKAGSDEMNYRRFFDVTNLAAICMENQAVFEETHRYPLALAATGRVDGFRIDHIDGLLDPSGYLWRLQCGLLNALVPQVPSPPDSSATSGAENECRDFLRHFLDVEDCGTTLDRERRLKLPLFVVVEKILGADEPLPAEWPVQGTTGYDFLNLLNGLLLDGRGLAQLERHYVRFTDQRHSRPATIDGSKRLIVDGAMQSELQLLAHRLNRLSNRHRGSRDYTLPALRSALREIIASFSVYRTYIHGDVVSERDRRIVQRAVAQARRRNPATDASVFNFIRDVLLLEQPPNLDEAGRTERELLIGRLQQVTSPVMAKGIEDTAFYRHVPLVSINEVGCEPEHPATSVAEFHRQNSFRQSSWPDSLLATTTHDTKRTEDTRARINVLSEVPGLWRSAVQRWARINKRHHREVDGEPAPSRNDEWLFYQTLIGIWPPETPGEGERAALIERLQQYMEKAIHEAKLRTSWINPSPQYDAAVHDFVASTLSPASTRFVDELQAFIAAILPGGLYSALSQVLLKLCSPGIPDIYQGEELWDFSLVDPDNRRPVDYDRRRWLLSDIDQHTGEGSRAAFAARLAHTPRDDRLKLLVTSTALQFRRDWLSLGDCEYVPLEVQGSCAEHVVAFAWQAKSQTALVVAPRLIHTLTSAAGVSIPCGPEVWHDTTLNLEHIPGHLWQERMTGRMIEVIDGRLPLATLLGNFPVALATTPDTPSS